MITSRYIPNTRTPHFDAAVSAALDYEIDGGGNKMIIGIENGDGVVYRVIETRGMGAYMHTVNSILDLGFEDKLAESLHGEGGFDSRMTPSDLLLNVAAPQEAESNPVAELLSDLDEVAEAPETERQAILNSRIGQGIFRTKLIAYWGKCAVSGATCISLLRASHIKPWKSSTNAERLNQFNGLLLAPNIDAAFDNGFITFDRQGRIVMSRRMSGASAYQLHINNKMRIDSKLLATEHHVFLEHHREHVYSDA
jgi:hypothetical protein